MHQLSLLFMLIVLLLVLDELQTKLGRISFDVPISRYAFFFVVRSARIDAVNKALLCGQQCTTPTPSARLRETNLEE